MIKVHLTTPKRAAADDDGSADADDDSNHTHELGDGNSNIDGGIDDVSTTAIAVTVLARIRIVLSTVKVTVNGDYYVDVYDGKYDAIADKHREDRDAGTTCMQD